MKVCTLYLLPTFSFFLSFWMEAGGDSQDFALICPKRFFTRRGIACWWRQHKTVDSLRKPLLSTKPKPQSLDCGCYHEIDCRTIRAFALLLGCSLFFALLKGSDAGCFARQRYTTLETGNNNSDELFLSANVGLFLLCLYVPLATRAPLLFCS